MAALNRYVDDLITVYLREADPEGVRSDLPFTQAVAETGHFTNTPSINNFAGLARYDGTSSADGGDEATHSARRSSNRTSATCHNGGTDA